LFENFPRISKLKPSLEQAHQENFARLYADTPFSNCVCRRLIHNTKAAQRLQITETPKKSWSFKMWKENRRPLWFTQL